MTHSHITENLDLLSTYYKCDHDKCIISLYYELSTWSETVTLRWEPHIQQYGNVSKFVCTFISELTPWRKLQDLALATYNNRHKQCSTYLGIFTKGRHLTTPISGFSLVSSFSAKLSTILLGPATLRILCCCCANCPTTALESRASKWCHDLQTKLDWCYIFNWEYILVLFGINRIKFCIQYGNSVTKKVFNYYTLTPDAPVNRQISADVLRTIKHDWVNIDTADTYNMTGVQ